MSEIEVIGPRAYRAMPGPQTDFLLCPVQDVFFGGARGGSKTFSCLMDAANRADKYGKAFRGLFLRRTLEEFPEVNRAAEEIFSGIGSTYNKSDRLWTFRGGGTLRMRYLADDADAEQYMGHQLAAIYIDEAGNFPNRSPIDKLWGALRSPEGIPCVMRLTGNPGGPGHSHLFNRYVKWGHKTVVKWRPQPKLKPDFFMESVFIKSLLEDNVELMKADPEYENRLFAVGDEDLVRAWRYGDWSSLRGGYFAHTYDPARNIYASADLEPYFTRWAAIDWGYAHHSAIYFACFDGETTWVYKELILKERTPTDLAEDFARAVGSDKLDAIYLSPDAFARRSTPRAISDEMNEVMRWHKLPAVRRADNSRVSGWQLLSDLFRKGTLKIHESCETLRRAIPTTQRNPDHPEDAMKTSDVEDDARDALRYLLQSHPREAAVPPEIQIRRAITAKDPSWQLVQWENARRKVLAKAAPMRIGGRPR